MTLAIQVVPDFGSWRLKADRRWERVYLGINPHKRRGGSGGDRAEAQSRAKAKEQHWECG